MRDLPIEPTPPLADRLLAEVDWMRSLARRLVADADREDLVQDVLTQTLERPPQRPGGLRGWLGLAMRNRARDRGRRRHVRSISETGDSVDSITTPAEDVVARADAQRRLVEAVLGLDTPLRIVILLRYFDDRTPQEIAQELGVPASTVRSRLQRGLVSLRERLGGPSRVEEWLPALTCLAFGPTDGSVHWGQAATRTTGAIRPALGVGAALGAGVLALVAVGPGTNAPSLDPLTITGSSEAILPVNLVGSSAREASRTDALDDDLVAEEIDEGESRSTDQPKGPATEPEDDPRMTLEVVVTVDGEPTNEAEVLVRLPGLWFPAAGPTPTEGVERRELDAGGRARFELPLERSVVVAVEAGVGVRLQRTAYTGEGGDRSLTMKLGTAAVEGLVLGSSGRPAVDIPVAVGIVDGYDYGALSGRTRTDGAGRFRVDHLPASRFWVYAESAEGDDRDRRLHGQLEKGEVRSVVIGSPEPAIDLQGVLRNTTGEVCDVTEDGATGEIEFHARRADGHDVVAASILANGTFTTTLSPGRYEVRLRPADATTWRWLPEAYDVTKEETTLELVVPGVPVTGQVYLDGLGGTYDPAQSGALTVELLDSEDRAVHRTAVDASGRFRFHGLVPGRWSVRTWPRKTTEDPVVEVSDAPLGPVDLWVE